MNARKSEIWRKTGKAEFDGTLIPSAGISSTQRRAVGLDLADMG